MVQKYGGKNLPNLQISSQNGLIGPMLEFGRFSGRNLKLLRSFGPILEGGATEFPLEGTDKIGGVLKAAFESDIVYIFVSRTEQI